MASIPWDKKLLYANYVGLDEENTETFIAVISKLDYSYLSWVATERKKNSG